MNSLSAPAAAPPTAANKAPTASPLLLHHHHHLNLPCSSPPPRCSQRFAEAGTCGNFGSSWSWQWRDRSTTTAAVRAAFAHRKRGSGFPAAGENPCRRVPDGELCAALSFDSRTSRSYVRRFAPLGVKEVSVGAGMRGKRLAASTLECQSKFWNDISPPKKNGILWGVQERLGIPAPSRRLVLEHGEVPRGKKRAQRV